MYRSSQTCYECRPPPPFGPDNPRWRGGRKWRRNSPRGYVYISAPGHPRGRNNFGRVFEHVIVMESVLGRYLLPGETVHHRNGLRADNRPENLELWVKSQPAGCRVDDAVACAREILARYAQQPTCGGGLSQVMEVGDIEVPVQSKSSLDVLQA